MNFIFGKALLSLLFYTDNPYFFTTFFKFLSLLFPYFSVDGHLKACPLAMPLSRNTYLDFCFLTKAKMGAQWLSGRVLDSRPKGRGFEPHRRHCVVSLSKNINPSLVLVQPRKTHPFITERLLMGHKESNKQNKGQVAENSKQSKDSV